MSWTRAELKTRAKAAVKMYYWKMVLVALILSMIGGGASSVGSRSTSDNSAGSGARSMFEGINMQAAMIAVIIVLVVVVIALALSVFVFNVLEVGCRGFFSRSMTEDPELGLIADGFTKNYWNCVKTQFLKSLFIGLWSLLFVIPGVIKAYEYRMVPYLLAEHPEMSSGEIFARSKEMMQGNKWDTFVLDISFVGWVVFSIFSGWDHISQLRMRRFITESAARIPTATEVMAITPVMIRTVIHRTVRHRTVMGRTARHRTVMGRTVRHRTIMNRMVIPGITRRRAVTIRTVMTRMVRIRRTAHQTAVMTRSISRIINLGAAALS